MANTFNYHPYHDDYNEDKRFLRILFRPGYAVQARELTQLQTILQKQFERLGNHIFKEGSMVIPGGVSIDTNVSYVKLQLQFSGVDINVNNFLGKTVIGKTSGAVAEVINVEAVDGGDPNTLFVIYKTGVSSRTITATTSTGSNHLTTVSPNLAGSIAVGTRISGSGISSNTYVTAVDSNGTIYMSANASGNNVGTTLTLTTATEFTAGETIVTYDGVTFETFKALAAASTPCGVGSTAAIKEGVYYVNGFFVKVESQSIVVSKYSNTPSNIIGLRVSDMIVDVDDDSSLADPANGSPNYNAPGADRYRVDLTLEAIPYATTTEDNSFVALIRVNSGVVEAKVEYSEYAELEKTLARRTYDESGDYTVKPFRIDVRESLDNGTNRGVFLNDSNTIGSEAKLAIGLEAGKAYVKGFEIETLAVTYLLADKGRDTAAANNARINALYGNYVIVDNLAGTFNPTDFEVVDLKEHTDSNATSTTIGTARVKAIQYYSGTVGNAACQYKLYLSEISISLGGKKFDDVRFIERTGVGVAGPSCKPVLESGVAVLYDTNPELNTLIFEGPEEFIKSYDPAASAVDVTYDVFKRFTGTTNGSNQVVIDTGSNNFSFSPTSTDYIVTVDSTGAVRPVTVVSLGLTNNRQATLTVGVSGTAVTILAKVSKSVTNHVASPVKTKTVTTRTQNGLAHGATVALDKADAFEIVAIIDNNGAGVDVTSRYTLDTGQRDNYYGISKLVFKTGYPTPTGTLQVQYRYFAHGTGDYFSVDSYATIAYDAIPSYTSTVTSKTYRLSDVLDFRPRINDAGTGFTGTGAITSEVPMPNSAIVADFDYYLPRYDKVCLNRSGDFFIQRGTSSINPVPPTTPDDSMVLYLLRIPAYTLSTSDVSVKYIDNKRYTMRDIGNLEKRIENLEYYTTLSLLEKETASFFIDDGLGNDRFKNGFIVDNFTSHLVGDSANADYHCSIDSANKELRAPYWTESIELDLNTGSSTNYAVTGDLVTLPYSHAEFIKQPYASRTYNVNEFLIFEWVGKIALDPAVDNWKDTTSSPDLVVTMADDYDLLAALAEDSGIENVRWNAWQTEWLGAPKVTSKVTTTRTSNGSVTALTTTTTKTGVQTRTGVETTLVPNTVSYNLGDRIVDASLATFMRSRDVAFTATSLKPNTRVYAFFDGVDVNSYITPTGGTLGGSLITDNYGTVSGVFTIPNTNTLKFNTGQRQLRLTDQADNSLTSVRTSAIASYQAEGLLLNKEKTILSTRVAEISQNTVVQSNTVISSTSNSTVIARTVAQNNTQQGGGGTRQSDGGNRDPLAQTFLVDNSEGVFITKIDLFFKTKSTTAPVTVEIRTVDNGYPAPSVVPFGSATLNPPAINTSTTATLATTFTFPSPVYLLGNTEYAIVVKAVSTDYEIWCATLGQNQVGSDSRISEQPTLGSLFLSQNDSAWTAVQESDLKFTLYRAEFNTAVTGAVILQNSALPSKALPTDPFTTTNASSTVTVYHPNHGLQNSSYTTISGVSGTIHGITAANLNGTRQVSNVTIDTYQVTAGGNANVTGIGGGTGIRATENDAVDVLCPAIGTLELPQTLIGFSVKTTDKAYTLASSYQPITNQDNNYFSSARIVASQINETNLMSGNKSLLVKADLSSELSTLSPVIDLSRTAVMSIGNRINNDSTNETSPNDVGNALAKYLTKKIVLDQPANMIKVLFAANCPTTASILVYYKVLEEFDNTTVFDSKNFTQMTAVNSPAKDSDTTAFRDYDFQVTGLNNFTTLAIKIVMLSTDTALVPRVKELRVLALT